MVAELGADLLCSAGRLAKEKVSLFFFLVRGCKILTHGN
jgi:hypothetical protein